MGDGRYYTNVQFFNIIFLTMLIIFIVISIMLFLYKSSRNKGSKNLIYIYICLVIVIVSKFMETVIVSQDFAYILTFISSLTFIIINILFIHFLLIYIIDSFLYTKKKLTKIYYNFIYVLLGIFLLTSFTNKRLIIFNYSFNAIKFGALYVVAVITCLVFILLINVFIFFNRKNKDIFKINIGLLYITNFLLWIIPLGSYYLSLIKNGVDHKIVERVVFMLFAINLNVLSSYFMPYRISSSLFNDVKDLMLDYVFIIDSTGKVIYRNNSVLRSNIFKNLNIININNIENIFSEKVITRNAYNKIFIKYLDNENRYFSYNKKDIISRNKVAGSIITFIEITDLIKMLDKLKQQQDETEKSHIKLFHYSKIVYNLEKEKEINTLLDEIADNQQKTLLELKYNIQSLIKNSNNDFTMNVEKIITKAKKDLFDIRQAVTAYMNYYGGGDD